MVDTKTPGQRLREAREARGLKQEELAAAAGIHTKTVSKWENDRQAPQYQQLLKAEPVLGVSASWILDGREALETSELAADPVGSATVTRPLPRALRSHAVRVWLSAFRHELTRANASDEQIAEAVDLLTAPQVFTYYRGGSPGELSEDEAIVAMEALAKFIRQRLRRRGLKFPAGSE